MKNSIIKRCLILSIIGMFLVVNLVPSLTGISINRTDFSEEPISFRDTTSRATTLYVGGSGPNNYTSIQDAIDDSLDGDTIYIYDDSSPYYENIFVYKTLIIVGENTDTTIINGNNLGDVISVTKDSVRIEYLTVTNSGSGSEDAGIEINNVQFCRIKHVRCISNSIGLYMNNTDSNYIQENIFSSNSLYGGYLFTSGYNIFDDNICNDNGVGIYLFSSDNNMVRENYCNNNVNDGIRVSDGCDGFSISWNFFENSTNGIFIQDGYDIILENNVCNNNDIGIYLLNSYDIQGGNNTCYNNNNYGFYLQNTSDSQINNNICGNNNYGILLSSSSDDQLVNNQFYGGSYGVYLDTCNNIDVNSNDCMGNSYGIYIDVSDSNAVNYNDCSNSTNYGVYLSFSTYNLVSFTNCTNCNDGVYLDNSNNNNIFNNICTNGYYGIYATNSDNSNFNFNECLNNIYGIYIENTDNADINDNNCSDNTYGIFVPSATLYDVNQNSCYNNVEVGIYLSSIQELIVDNNDCVNNNVNINISNCLNVSISLNNCRDGVYGLYLSSTPNDILYLNDFMDNTYGMFIEFSDNLNILENTCFGNNFGAYISSSSGNDIETNQFLSNSIDGIFLTNFNNSNITDNTINFNSGNGLSVSSSSNCEIYENTISDNILNGIDVSSCSFVNVYENSFLDNIINGINFNNCDDVDIYDNIFNSNNASGIYCSNINTMDVRNNTLTDNVDGIYILNSNDILITENWVLGNNFGLELDTSGNVLTYNNFFNNTNNAIDNGNNVWNISLSTGVNIIGGAYIGGNYWADYNGEDFDLDGIGDSELPFNCSGLIQNGGDYLPLVNIPPFVPGNPYPQDGAINTGTNLVLSWSGGDPDPGDSVVYDIYFGNTFPPTQLLSEKQSQTSCPTGQIEPSQTYFWQVVAFDSVGASVSGPIWTFNTSDNSPPSAPIISGRTNGEVDRTYQYVFISSDPDGDDLYYSVFWGDGTVDEWVGPIESDSALVLDHSFRVRGTFTVMARAKDVNDAIGPWSTMEVRIPRSRHVPSFIQQFLERFFELFPVFKQIMRLIDIF